MQTEQLRNIVAKGKMRHKIYIYSIAAALILATLFIILALVFQRREIEEYESDISIVMFIIAGICLVVSALVFFVYFRLIRSRWYYNHLMATRLLTYRDFIASGASIEDSINTQYLPIDNKPITSENLNTYLAEKLTEYSKKELEHGTLYYTLAANALNSASSSIDAFYLLKENIKNSYIIDNENQQIRDFALECETYLKKEFNDNEFYHVVSIFLEEQINASATEFYHNFYGRLKTNTGTGGKIHSAQIYTYLAIDAQTGKLFAYLPLTHDTGTPANLENLIKDELL